MSFVYVEPTTVTEALDLLAEYGPGARLLAGGTDLMVLIRRRKVTPTHLISLGRVPALDRLTVEDGQVVIGSQVRHRAIEQSPIFAGALQALPEACTTVGSVQIRNVGTVGGNLCNASPAADTPPVLLAFGATATIAGRGGIRQVPLDQFYRGYRQTALAPDELLLDVRLPLPGPRSGSAFQKIGRRKAMEISIACTVALVTLSEDVKTFREVRIGLGSVAPVSIRSLRAEEILRGQAVTAENVKRAAREAAAECSPIDDLRASGEYRRMVVETLVARALERAIERTGSGAAVSL